MRFTVLTAMSLMLVASAVRGQERRLGPKDEGSYPPTDTARVSVGAEAPDFTLESRDGSAKTLSGYRGAKNVILVFYRGHW
jgi:hypothetical protein